jgi:hypothetical protein
VEERDEGEAEKGRGGGGRTRAGDAIANISWVANARTAHTRREMRTISIRSTLRCFCFEEERRGDMENQ